jgi:hypothetical protein
MQTLTDNYILLAPTKTGPIKNNRHFANKYLDIYLSIGIAKTVCPKDLKVREAAGHRFPVQVCLWQKKF